MFFLPTTQLEAITITRDSCCSALLFCLIRTTHVASQSPGAPPVLVCFLARLFLVIIPSLSRSVAVGYSQMSYLYCNVPTDGASELKPSFLAGMRLRHTPFELDQRRARNDQEARDTGSFLDTEEVSGRRGCTGRL